MTLIDLLTQTLIGIGAYNPGETIEAGEAQVAVDTLQVLTDSWNAEGFLAPFATQESYTLTAGQASYTWGSSGGADITTGRPNKILRAFIRDGGNDYAVDLIGGDEYESYSDKTLSGRPEKLWMNPTYPLVTIVLYFTPDASYELHLDTEKDIIDFTNLTDEISLPPEYLAALKWNLAIELCPSYMRQPSAFMMQRADDTLRALRRINAANKLEPVALDIFTAGRGTQGSILSYD